MKKALLSILFIQMIFLTLISTAFSQCGTVADDLSLVLPCVEYEGAYYKLNFSAYANPADPTWLYWRYESLQLASGGSSCAHADAALTITAPCVYYAGYNIAMTLEYCPNINPAEPNWPYWKLGPQPAVNPVTINSISGDTMQCIDMSEFQASLDAFVACMQQCAEDAACLVACMPDLGFGGAFSLTFELYNPGITPIEFILPAGAFFEPGAGDVQPMLIAVDEILTAPSGLTVFCVPTYCMDLDAHVPSDVDMYGIAGAGIAQQACIAEILDLIRGKTEISHADSSIIQEVIWDCMEFGSITEDQRVALQNL